MHKIQLENILKRPITMPDYLASFFVTVIKYTTQECNNGNEMQCNQDKYESCKFNTMNNNRKVQYNGM